MNLLNAMFRLLAKTSIDWHPEDSLDVLPMMGKGMLVIFVIIGVIILATLLINKIFSKKNDDK